MSRRPQGGGRRPGDGNEQRNSSSSRGTHISTGTHNSGRRHARTQRRRRRHGHARRLTHTRTLPATTSKRHSTVGAHTPAQQQEHAVHTTRSHAQPGRHATSPQDRQKEQTALRPPRLALDEEVRKVLASGCTAKRTVRRPPNIRHSRLCQSLVGVEHARAHARQLPNRPRIDVSHVGQRQLASLCDCRVKRVLTPTRARQRPVARRLGALRRGRREALGVRDGARTHRVDDAARPVHARQAPLARLG